MAVTIKDLRFSIYLNNEQAKKSAMDMQKQLQMVGDEMAQLAKEGKKDTDVYRQKKKELDGLKDKYSALKKEAGLYGMSMKELRKLSMTMKNDMDRMIPNSKEWTALKKDLDVVNNRIKTLKVSANGTESSLSKMATGFNKYFAIGTSIIAGAVLVGSAVYGMLKKTMEFSKAVSELSALTGATGKDLDFLKDKSKDLGKQYGKSATEIVTAMKLVGSAKPELLSNVAALGDVTKSVLTLSKATGMELSEATNSVTTIMNQFNLSAVEADRVINVLAAGSKYGAKEVDYLGEAISKVGTVAKAAGLSLETTTAIVELFGEKGIKAESAGNGFKRVLVELQSDTDNYTNGVFDLNKAIDNNQKIAGDNIALQKKFGTEFFSLAQILLQNKERFEQLTKQVTGTTVAEEQMRIATDNLSGDIEKMSASWDSFILGLEDGQGPIAKVFRGLIQWTKEAIDALGKLTKSDNVLNIDAYTKEAEKKIKIFKEVQGADANKTTTIEDEINFEKNVVLAMEKKLELTKKQIQAEKDKYGIFQKGRVIITQGEREVKDLAHSLNIAKTYINMLGGMRSSSLVKVIATNEDNGGGLGTPDAPKAKDKKVDPFEIELKEKEAAYNKSMLQEKQFFANGVQSEEDTQKYLLEAKKKFLNDKLQLEIKYGKDTTGTLTELADMQIEQNKKTQDEIAKQDDQAAKDKENFEKEVESIIEKYGATAEEKLKAQKNLELSIAKQAYDQGIIDAMQYAEIMKNILESGQPDPKDWLDKAQEVADGVSEIAGNASGAMQNFQSAEEKAIETKYQKQIDAARKAGEDTTAIEEKKNEELAEIRRENADKNFLVTAASIIAQTASAAINSFNNATVWGSPIAGGIAAAAAVAFGMSQLAQANAAREAAKEGYMFGGYTGDGREDEPAGTVHRGEFVTNAKGVRNPHVRKFLDVFNQAQMNGSIQMINTTQILERVRREPAGGYQGGGYVQSAAPGGKSDSNDYLVQMIAQNNSLMLKLNRQLDNGISAISVVSGKHGSYEQTKQYEKFIKNASR